MPPRSRVVTGGLTTLVVVAGSVMSRSLTESQPEQTPAEQLGSTGEPIVIGHKLEIESEVLGETRTVRIALPKGYVEFERTCGVLYLLDGETLFVQAVGAMHHRSKDDVLPMIVVGIDNTERTRDLTPPAGPKQMADFPTAGGSAAFRRFLIDEVRPFIEAAYRTNEVRVLAGHSFGGLFAAETLLVEPEAFTGYLSLSPSLWWDDEALVERFKEVPLDHGMFGCFAWFAMGEEAGMMNAPFEAATWAFKERAPKRFRWGRETFAKEGHWAAALPGLGTGLREFMAPIRDIGQGVATFEELQDRATALAETFGEALPLGRDPVIDAVQTLARQGDVDAALAFLDAAIEVQTDEPLLCYMRADILGGEKRFAEAIEAIEGAIERFGEDPKHKMPLVWLRRSLVAMKGKLESKQGE